MSRCVGTVARLVAETRGWSLEGVIDALRALATVASCESATTYKRGFIMTGSKPVKEFRMGFTTAAIFEQPLERGSVFNVSVSRLYKPDEDAPEWKRSTFFGRDDLPHVLYVAEKAHEWIHLHQQASRRAKREADAAMNTASE